MGLSVAEDNFQRGLLWEAGWVHADSPELSVQEMLGMVSWNVADLYGLADGVGRIVAGTRANLVLHSGEPGQLSSRLMMIVDGSKAECDPKQA